MEEKEIKSTDVKRGVMFRGIQTKISALVVLAVIISIVSCMWVAIPLFQEELGNSVSSNMRSLAIAYGAELEAEIDKNGGEMLDTESLSKIIGGITVEGIDGSYCYLVDCNGTMLMHTTAEKIGQPVENEVVKNVVSQIAKGVIPEAETVEYLFKGDIKLASYCVLEGNNSILVISADKKVALQAIDEFVKRNIICAVLTLIVVGALSIFIARSIVKPIQHLTKVINRNADFDFTEDEKGKTIAKGKDETAKMSQSLETMRENISGIVGMLSEVAGKLQTNSIGLNGIVERLNSDSCDNSATSEELAASMEETSATTALIDERMGQIDENAKKIGELTVAGGESASQIIAKAEGLKRNTENANRKTQEIYSHVKKESNEAIEKAKEIGRINELTDAIAAIASQTELLSLNASIEAARAGEAGRGFAVVAGEIGNLASQSTETANNISSIVAGVEDAATSMGKCLREMIAFMEETVIADYQNFINVSEEYSADARDFSDNMKTIRNSIEELEQNIEDIANSIQGINSTVNEAAISIGDIASKATDMVGLAGDTGSKAEDNAMFAEQLDSIVKQFTI